MENHSLGEAMGSSDARFLNSLARDCALATNYFGVAHPSLPNYIAATSGSTQGISDDAPPASHPIAGPSIYSALGRARKTWGEYEEDAPTNCPQTSSGTYATKHDPAVYYVSIRSQCQRWDVPLGTTSAGALQRALASNHLPTFSFVTPNLCNDMHDCSVATGDAWLQKWMTRIISSPAYRSNHLAIMITWDESDPANQVPLLVVGPSVARGGRISARLDHYSLLKTTQQLLGLRPLLGAAADPGTRSFISALRVSSSH